MTPVPKQALLLCAGIGSRLRPFTDGLPKCLMPICGRPLLDLWLEHLVSAGVRDILVNTHHHAEIVDRHVRGGPFADAVTLVHEPELLGTAGTLALHAGRFGSTFLLAHADNVSVFDLSAFAERHARRRSSTAMTMMTFKTDRPQDCGIVECEAGVVVRFHEKVPRPPGNLASGAVFLAEPEVARIALAAAGPPPADFSRTVVPRLLHRIETFENDIYHRDIGDPRSLARAQFEFPLALARAGYAASPLWRDSGLREGLETAVAASFARAGEAA